MSAGSRLAELMNAGSGDRPVTVSYGTVVSVSGSSMTVSVDGSDLAGIPFTTACAGASKGNSVLVLTSGSLSTVIGVISG